MTTVGIAPILPEQIRVLYTDGVYEMTDVEWEDIAPELYNKNGIFTVGGSAGGLDVEVQVLVVSGEQIQLEQLPDTKADSIMGDGNSTWLPVSSLITNGADNQQQSGRRRMAELGTFFSEPAGMGILYLGRTADHYWIRRIFRNRR